MIASQVRAALDAAGHPDILVESDVDGYPIVSVPPGDDEQLRAVHAALVEVLGDEMPPFDVWAGRR